MSIFLHCGAPPAGPWSREISSSLHPVKCISQGQWLVSHYILPASKTHTKQDLKCVESCLWGTSWPRSSGLTQNTSTPGESMENQSTVERTWASTTNRLRAEASHCHLLAVKQKNSPSSLRFLISKLHILPQGHCWMRSPMYSAVPGTFTHVSSMCLTRRRGQRWARCRTAAWYIYTLTRKPMYM